MSEAPNVPAVFYRNWRQQTVNDFKFMGWVVWSRRKCVGQGKKFVFTRTDLFILESDGVFWQMSHFLFVDRKLNLKNVPRNHSKIGKKTQNSKEILKGVICNNGPTDCITIFNILFLL
jgi:hypothetical protein